MYFPFAVALIIIAPVLVIVEIALFWSIRRELSLLGISYGGLQWLRWSWGRFFVIMFAIIWFVGANDLFLVSGWFLTFIGLVNVLDGVSGRRRDVFMQRHLEKISGIAL